MPDRPFNIAVSLIRESQFVDVIRGCKGFMFTNIGDTICEVNGMVVNPPTVPNTLGDSRSIGADKDDLYKGNLKVSFTLPLGVNPLIELVQIFYSDVK
jgi:hypothetical protein